MSNEEKIEQAKENLQRSIDQLAVYAYCDEKEKLLIQAARVRKIRQQYLDLVEQKPKTKFCGSPTKTCSALGDKRKCQFAGDCVFQLNKS